MTKCGVNLKRPTFRHQTKKPFKKPINFKTWKPNAKHADSSGFQTNSWKLLQFWHERNPRELLLNVFIIFKDIFPSYLPEAKHPLTRYGWYQMPKNASFQCQHVLYVSLGDSLKILPWMEQICWIPPRDDILSLGLYLRFHRRVASSQLTAFVISKDFCNFLYLKQLHWCFSRYVRLERLPSLDLPNDPL